MATRLEPYPVWAGIAVRLSDGTMTVVEIDYPTEFTVETQAERYETFHGLVYGGPHRIEARISGHLSTGTRWSDAARRDAPAAANALPAAPIALPGVPAIERSDR